MKKKMFLQIFLLTFVCALIMFAYGIIAVKTSSKAIITNRLVEETKLVGTLLNDADDFEKFSDYHSGGNAYRITVIDLQGKVLYESDMKSPMESHLNREEFQNAVKGTPRAVDRYSQTLGHEMTYYAIKTSLDDGSEVVLRLAVKSSEINDYIGMTIPAFIVVLCISLACSLFFANLISGQVTKKINDVSVSLQNLNKGNYKPIKTDSKDPEMYAVLNEINDLNAGTHKLIRKETEERNKLNTVLESVVQGIFAIDGDKKIILANKSVLNLFGCETDVSGKDMMFLIDDLPLCEFLSAHIGEDTVSEYPYKGRILSVVTKKAEGINGGGVCSIVIFTDITAEKEMARQKSDFFANASHELKTPVAVMQGLSELLMQKDLDEASKKQVQRIHTESIRLASLISDMLELSRLENGEKVETVTAEVDLKEIADEVINELLPKINEKNITATVSGKGVILGDSKKIFELVENLCGNAVNYNAENGKVDVEITESDETVTLNVSDTGIGIEKENIPRLCERFYRVDKSRSKKTGGTGLGLAIVKHICALYNATLSIDSDLGLGTTVTVVFNK